MFRVISVLGFAFLAAVALSKGAQKNPDNCPQDKDVQKDLADRVLASPGISLSYYTQFSAN